MAGHSKWANIRFRKGAQDAKRGKIFTKLIREITTAARAVGGDPEANPRLRLAIDKAKAQSMPKDNIDRAVKRGAGGLDGDSYEEVRYEGYGPGGVAVMVDCLTDNRNRTVAEVRHAFTKLGGNLGSDGSVAYLFEHVGLLSYPAGSDEEQVTDAAIESGASDVIGNDDGSLDVIGGPEDFAAISDAMRAAGLKPEHAEVTMRASTRLAIDADAAQSLSKLLDMLDDLDDVQQVYSNAEFPEALLEESA
ncbi:YebC/PmpR family DNA-binding transcriptional regulator [Candidatus Rariloculus sp.]|uniref:YebC/PmpR family DNA-binding transcriptional regulator n=1 Tax=Candidatus Rariloculus sp. TaxID=3101265 RepID=UPI003D097897